jgi:hypothetical protein
VIVVIRASTLFCQKSTQTASRFGRSDVRELQLADGVADLDSMLCMSRRGQEEKEKARKNGTHAVSLLQLQLDFDRTTITVLR